MNIQKYLDNIFNDIDENLKLDEEQKEVVLDENNHLMVVAGAGSGKTLTLVAKVKYLVEIKKVRPDEILIISLTNKAIEELKERINIESRIPVIICTFHKLAYDIMKKEDVRYKVNNDTNKVLKKIILEMPDTGKVIRNLRRDKIYKRSDNNSLNSINTLCDFTNEIIKLIKTLGIDINNIEPQYKITANYLNYLQEVYIKYNETINEEYKLDFEDLILRASNLKNMHSNYKYILVDEYQDISINRYKLLKKIIDATNAKTIVVGDDFQAIFSFAGANMNLFLDYRNQMRARMIKLVNTYRNSQQLIDVAGEFVMKNSNQIEKKLQSKKNLDRPIKIYGYERNMEKIFEFIILNLIEKYGDNKNILVLGRYKNDILKIKSNKFIIKEEKIIYKKNRNIKIKFMTIHASKGLGFDNVVLINFRNDYMGFPSNIKDSLIKKDIFKIGDNIEEERRLFYVALTRTKNEIYILTEKNNESLFINELYNNENVYIDYNLKRLKKHLKHKIR